MARDLTSLATEVLDLLGVTQLGQDPEQGDINLVLDKIDTVLASLARRNVVYVQNKSDIPNEFFNPLAVIVANNVGPKYGQSFDASTDALQESLPIQMQPVRRSSEPLRIDYF